VQTELTIAMVTYDEEAAEMIERTKEDPNAIILGRFFSYKEN
jgi:hypothetical protein